MTITGMRREGNDGQGGMTVRVGQFVLVAVTWSKPVGDYNKELCV